MRIRPRGAEGAQVDCAGGDPQALKLEDRIEARDAGRECDEDEHGPGHALVHVLEQDVEGQGQEDKEGLIQQVGDDAQADQSGVGDDVPRRGRRVAGHVHLGFHKAFGKAAEDADEQVEDAGDAREALLDEVIDLGSA